MRLLVEAADRFVNFGSKLPWLERITYYVGTFSVVYGAVETELANPIIAAVHTILGTAAVIGSVSTTEAIEVLDNRGKL